MDIVWKLRQQMYRLGTETAGQMRARRQGEREQAAQEIELLRSALGAMIVYVETKLGNRSVEKAPELKAVRDYLRNHRASEGSNRNSA